MDAALRCARPGAAPGRRPHRPPPARSGAGPSVVPAAAIAATGTIESSGHGRDGACGEAAPAPGAARSRRRRFRPVGRGAWGGPLEARRRVRASPIGTAIGRQRVGAHRLGGGWTRRSGEVGDDVRRPGHPGRRFPGEALAHAVRLPPGPRRPRATWTKPSPIGSGAWWSGVPSLRPAADVASPGCPRPPRPRYRDRLAGFVRRCPRARAGGDRHTGGCPRPFTPADAITGAPGRLSAPPSFEVVRAPGRTIHLSVTSPLQDRAEAALPAKGRVAPRGT